MSILTSNHVFVAFDSKTSKPFQNQRLSKILYKTPKAGNGEKKQSMCVSIPALGSVNEDQLQRLVPHLTRILEDAQDGICKDRYESGAVGVSSEDISVDSCIAYMDAESTGDRLTKEFLTSWFDSVLADTLYLHFGEKLIKNQESGETEQEKQQIEGVVHVYGQKFVAMSGGRTLYNLDTAKKLQSVLAQFVDSEDDTAVKLNRKLDSMIRQQQDTLEAL